MEMTDESIFKDFTNLYELSKTLRFELKPIEGTTDLLKKNQVFEKDKAVHNNYLKAKKYFDKLHCEFIDKALKQSPITENDYKEYSKLYYEYKQNKQKNYKKWADYAKVLRTKIVKGFEQTTENLRDEYAARLKDEKQIKKIKKLSGLELLFKTEVFGLLKEKYGEEKDVMLIDKETGEASTIFDCFNKFTTYFDNFHQSRKNFYKDDGTETAIATRIIDENLPKFLDNKKIFEEKYGVLNLSSEEKGIFNLKYFNRCFTQSDINKYNEQVGKIQSKVNEYRQTNEKIPFLKELFKQILSEKGRQETEQDSFIGIENNKQVFDVLNTFIATIKSENEKTKVIFDDFIKHQDEFDLDKIFIKGNAINTISNKWFQSWNSFGVLLPKNTSNKNRVRDFVSIKEIKEALENSKNEIKQQELFKKEYFEKNIISLSNSAFENFLNIWKKEFKETIEICTKTMNTAEKMIQNDKVYTNKKGILNNGKEGEKQKEIIHDFAESALGVYQMMKYFELKKGKKSVSGMEEDGRFYNDYNSWLNSSQTWLYFNEFRNYLTKKPYDESKIKLNFECGYLLSGWSQTYETYGALIFRQDNRYYLGIINGQKFNESEIGSLLTINNQKDAAQRLVYDFQKPDNKNVPRLFIRSKGENFAPAVEELNLPIESIINIYDKGLYKTENKNNPNYPKSLEKLINYFKLGFSKHKSYKHFNFKWKESSKYANIADFYQDTIRSCYKLSWENINFEALKKLSADGRLYLFQIHNKDFELDKSIAPNNYNFKGEGRNNLHTQYFKLLFDNENLQNKTGIVFKLSGGGEIFCRKGSIKKQIDEKRKAPQKVIINKRYTEDKFFLHFPIQLNYARNDERINDKTISAITKQDKQRIIGIDRGEKHLLYVSVVDEKGNILESKSFNTIKVPDKTEPDDYHKLLDEKGKGRAEARKTWQEIENIKELKTGYISQVVHEIDKLIFKSLEDGIVPMIVFEDLNIGFKRGRFKIEKQVYQKFELALAKKLNYLVSKEKKNHLEAVQLTPPITNFQDIRKQTGIIFYVPASFTSAICPVCGSRKRLYGFIFKNIEQAKKLLSDHNFKITFDGDKFLFTCKASHDDNDRKSKNKNELFQGKPLNDQLRFSSDVERLINIRSKDNKKWGTKPFNSTKKLEDLFKEKINLNGDIMEQIYTGKFEADFYRQLIFIINTILKIRNSHTEEGRDFIACPLCGFHSEKNLLSLDKKYLGKEKFEFNGDANGAYNIARKGILIAKKIKQFAEETNDFDKFSAIDHLQIEMKEWDKFVQPKLI